MKRIRHIFFAVLVLLIIFFISCPIVNDMTAKRVSQDIWETPLPSDTVKIEKISMAGKLVGNGNGMQFFGAVLIQSDLSLDDLRDFYSDYSKNDWSYVVEKQMQQEIPVIEQENLSFRSNTENGSFFIIYSWGSGISPFCELDLRGH